MLTFVEKSILIDTLQVPIAIDLPMKLLGW